MEKMTRKQRLESLRVQMEKEQNTFIPHWKDLKNYILPYWSRFAPWEVNKGEKKMSYIYDTTATQAANTLSSGMMAGITSPARPWFRLTIEDPALAENDDVKAWADVVARRMHTVLLRSNFYDTCAETYTSLGVFGTACMLAEEDFENVVHFYSFPVGEFMLANDSKLRTRVFARKFMLTVRQIVEKFGLRKSEEIDWSNISERVKKCWDAGSTEEWIEVIHFIVPNDEFDGERLYSKDKAFLSCYYETGNDKSGQNYMSANEKEKDKYLSESGYDLFPVLAPRWSKVGTDVYATNCPGMTSLGDVKQLQVVEKRAIQGLEKMVNPALQVPVNLRNQKVSGLPGDITYVDDRNGSEGIRTLHEVNINHSYLENKQEQVRYRIRRNFYEDMFLPMSIGLEDRKDITATEIVERREEKLLALGPVISRINNEFLDPVVDIVFDFMNRQGMIPPPPEEIQGMPLKIEYISIMAQAQKLIGISMLERFVQFGTALINSNPNNPAVLDKIDYDQLIDEYSNSLGLPAGVVKSDELVASIREQQQKAVAAQQAAELAKNAGAATKSLAASDTGGKNALTDLLQTSNAGGMGERL